MHHGFENELIGHRGNGSRRAETLPGLWSAMLIRWQAGRQAGKAGSAPVKEEGARGRARETHRRTHTGCPILGEHTDTPICRRNTAHLFSRISGKMPRWLCKHTGTPICWFATRALITGRPMRPWRPRVVLLVQEDKKNFVTRYLNFLDTFSNLTGSCHRWYTDDVMSSGDPLVEDIWREIEILERILMPLLRYLYLYRACLNIKRNVHICQRS